MVSTKYVIEIICKAVNPFEYDKYYYFASINIKNTFIEMTGDIWEAIKFDNLTSKDADSWCNFIKDVLGENYDVNIKTITLNYSID